MANAGSIDAELVRALFRAAVELKPEARAKFVQDGSPNENIRVEVERLLLEHELAGNTISCLDNPRLDIQRPYMKLSEGGILAGRFKITRFIAAGGMGEVYEAEDCELREHVAIKTIHPSILQQPNAVLLFKREVHLARQVTHPNVCRIFDLFRHVSAQGDSTEEIVFVSMELLHGKTLSAHLKEKGRMCMQDALPLVEQMAAALSAAHDVGIVHHDFKPSNVMLARHENAEKPIRVVVTDFGLASRSISSGADCSYATLNNNREIFGTPAYMAPEQIEGRPGTTASDVYALGLVIYEMVTGEHPFGGDTPMSTALRRLSETPVSPRKFAPELSANWEAVVLRCLERDPVKRFSTAQEISAALTNGSQLSELGALQDAASSLAVDEHSFVERQARVLEAAAPKESAVGRSTEVVAMVRRIESGGLREYLDNEVVPSVIAEDVRERPFELDFVLDERGKPEPVEICLRLDSPDFQPPCQTKKLRVPPRGDSAPCTFLIRPTIAGELVANLELLMGEEVVVSRAIRTRALAEGTSVRDGINIVSIPLTITVQDSIARVTLLQALPADHQAGDLDSAKQAIDLSQLQAHLKQQIIGKHLQEVTALLENAELLKAKDQLLLALQVDRQNTEANLLLREVQQRIQRTQIKDQVQELRRQAEEALARKQFEPALRCLERAAGLDTTDVELQQLRESIQAAWSQELELQERLRRAESAHQVGDLDSAKQAMEEALQIAPEKVQAATLYRTIQRDLEARGRQRQLDSYLEQARREIAARNFTSALEKLKLAESVDPGAPQVKALVESATLGREQEQRRRELETITRQIEEALNRDDYVAACQKVDEGLKRFPEERTVLKLKSLAEKQRQLAERKQFVDEQLNYARTLVQQGRNEELLGLLQAALAKTGPEPRLQSFLLAVRENVEHERSERRKTEDLTKANDALSRKSYDEAFLPRADYAELKDSTEIADFSGRAQQKTEKKRRLEVQQLTEQPSSGEEGLRQPETGKANVVVNPRNVPMLVAAAGAILLGVVGPILWMLKPGAVPVEVKSTPLGTTVRIVSTGQECVTPYCNIKLPPGKHEMEFSHPGYTKQTQTISVQAKGPNTFPIALRELSAVASNEKPLLKTSTAPPPSTKTVPQSTTKPPPMASMRIRGWNKGSEVFLDNNAIGTIGAGGTFSSIPPGKHEIKVVDKKGESGTMQKSFDPDERAELAKKDFYAGTFLATPPPPASMELDPWPQVANSGSTDQLEQYRAQHPNSPHLGELEATLDKLYWDRAMGTGTAVAFEEYLAKSSNGKHRDEAQENLTWIKAESTNTIQAFRDYQRQHPQGPHFESAGKKIDDQRFQEAWNSENEAVLQAFLKDYPTGIRHDQIYGRLDGLVWQKTNKNDKASLQAYVARMPDGKYVGQTNDTIEKLNEAAKPPKPLKPTVDAKAEVLKLVDRYVKAYNDTSIEELRQIWPGIDKKRVSSVRDFFRTAQNVKSSYTLLEEPTVNGADATVKFIVVTTFIRDGQQQRRSSTLTLKLKPAPGTSGSWEISSVSED